VDDDRFRILDIPWRESKGACRARAEAMRLWRGEPWFLQVDSHCRFAGDWDDRLIRMMSQTQSPKPILSTYATPYTPGENEILEGAPLQMAFQGFTADGIPHMKPVAIPHWHSLHRPLRALSFRGFSVCRWKSGERSAVRSGTVFLGRRSSNDGACFYPRL
jgi:hypothetical protein